MNVRKITVPETVEDLPSTCSACGGTGRAQGTGKMPFSDFLMIAIDQGADGKGGLQTARKLNKIADKIEASDGQLVLEETEYDLVNRTVKAFPWNPGLARRCERYFLALEEAVSERVKKEEKEKEAKD